MEIWCFKIYHLSQGVLGVTAELVFGVLLWDEAAREGPEDYEGTPHVYLRVSQLPVDNNYVAFPPSADNLEYFYDCKKAEGYSDEDPLTTRLRLFLGVDEDEESREVVRHTLRVLQTYSQHEHILKYLAISLHQGYNWEQSLSLFAEKKLKLRN